MRIVDALLQRLIRRMKNDPGFRLQSTYKLGDAAAMILHRGCQILRGSWLKFRLKESSGLCFCGRGVIVRYARKVKAGRSLILEDRVIIDGLSSDGVQFGGNVTVGRDTILQCTGVLRWIGKGIRIGDNSAVGAQSFLGGQGGIEIGSNVIMGPGVRIFSENHNFGDKDAIIRQQGESRKGVKIDDNCWIGAGVTILDGVTISSGVVVAAGAVVTHDLPENSFVAGVPARVVRSRITANNPQEA
jgi:acetyltransferase-like isoleucine patch superfamily enzyme